MLYQRKIGFKACDDYSTWESQNPRIVVLEIIGLNNEDRENVSDPLFAKHRCEKAYVLDIIDPLTRKRYRTARSLHDARFCYEVGKMVYPDSYDYDENVECGNGIHYFQTYESAMSFLILDDEQLLKSQYTGLIVFGNFSGSIRSYKRYVNGVRIFKSDIRACPKLKELTTTWNVPSPYGDAYELQYELQYDTQYSFGYCDNPVNEFLGQFDQHACNNVRRSTRSTWTSRSSRSRRSRRIR